MPRPRPGYRQLSVQIPDEVGVRIEQVASATGRSLAEEVAHALNRHADNPPRVRVVHADPLPDVEPLTRTEVPDSPPKKRRGRPRKNSGEIREK